MIDEKTIIHFDLHTHSRKITEDYLPSVRPLKVMVTSGASCPDALVERVIERLAVITGNQAMVESVEENWNVLAK
jgi:4-hydroxy-3-methylbut-2-enyl diphosphate reductase